MYSNMYSRMYSRMYSKMYSKMYSRMYSKMYSKMVPNLQTPSRRRKSKTREKAHFEQNTNPIFDDVS